MSIRVLVTGSRYLDNERLVATALLNYTKGIPKNQITVVHGGAPGCDTLAGMAASRLGMQVEVHPADWKTHGKAAGPLRNKHMVDLGADICLAFPVGDSRGTRGCMRLAKEAGIPVYNITEE